MTSQQCVNSGKMDFALKLWGYTPAKGFYYVWTIISQSLFADLSSNLESTVLVQKPKFGGIKTNESGISHKFPQLSIFQNESLSCKLFRNTNADRGILGESWLPKQ